MSNELLIELFEYFDYHSLLKSFENLNHRISNVIYHCQVCVYLHDFYLLFSTEIKTKNIRSLYISHWNQSIFSGDIINQFFGYFIKIRSLSLYDIESDIMEQIILHGHFPRLERLVIHTDQNQRSIFQHFFNTNRYPFLRIYKDSLGQIEKLISTSSIEYVIMLNVSNTFYFLDFLNQSPNLKYFEGKLFFNNSLFNNKYVSLINYHSDLIYLNLEIFDKISLEIIIDLFKYTPRISHLKLKINTINYPQSTNPTYWETIFKEYLMQLKKLSLFVYTTTSDILANNQWNLILKKDQIWKQINKSNFWSSHQWTPTFNSGIPMPYIVYYWAKFQVA